MEDVIFSGSDARKPTAAAEVRLRFSGVLSNLTGPGFTESEKRGAAGGGHGNGHGHANGNGHAHGNGHANGNGHGNGHAAHDDAETDAADADHAIEELIQSVAREVEVTRRLYRSGESEYLIDGQICRLRDIRLLMDTGSAQGLRDYRAGRSASSSARGRPTAAS
jgi:hypothetical protein